MNVVCVGDCGVDHYSPSGERHFGGITANFARHARNQFSENDQIHIVSCVGSDEGADLVLSSLENSGIACHIERLPGATPVQYIEIEPNGEKLFVRYDEGVLKRYSFGPDERSIIARSDLLVAPVFLQIVDLFDNLMNIETAGLTAVDFADFHLDPNFALLQRYIDRIDIGFFGLSADDESTIVRVAEFAERFEKLFVVTLGAHGSRVYRHGQRFDCPSVDVDRVVDTTGAGDAYAAGFLAAYCHGNGVEKAMSKGARIAAKVVGHCGSYVLPEATACQ